MMQLCPWKEDTAALPHIPDDPALSVASLHTDSLQLSSDEGNVLQLQSRKLGFTGAKCPCPRDAANKR